MSKELWQITGKQQGRTFTVKVRAASHRDAVRIGSTTHMLVVHDCVLLDPTQPEVLQAKCIAAATLQPEITHELGTNQTESRDQVGEAQVRPGRLDRAGSGDPTCLHRGGAVDHLQRCELRRQPAGATGDPHDVARPDRVVERRRKRIYTDEALAQLPALLEQGLSREQIAEQIGGKVSSLQVVCSRKGISLSRRDRRRRPTIEPDADLTLQVKAQTMARLQQRAEATGTSETKLASRLLDLIAKEDLYDAVLDEAAT
jgi:hypothetical protein